MSYSVESPCRHCQLEEKCLDPVFIQAAVNGIHDSNNSYRKGFVQRAHFGGGIIKIDCRNFTPVEEKPNNP